MAENVGILDNDAQECVLICVRCDQKGADDPIVTFAESEDEAECPTCHRTYEVHSHRLVEPARGEHLSELANQYSFKWVLRSGTLEAHTIVCNDRAELNGGDLVSLVYYKRRMIGIANQTLDRWWDATEVSSRVRAPSSWAMRLTFIGAMLLAMAMLVQVGIGLREDFLGAGPLAWGACAVVIVLALTQPVRWLFKPRRSGSMVQR